MKVLVVEDNLESARTLTDLLELWGYEATVARDAKSATTIGLAFRPRVVLLDLGLPDGHGYDVAEQLRAASDKRKIHFVAITGFSQIADQLRSAAAGVHHHLMKPVNLGVLRDILDGYRKLEESSPAWA